MLSCNSNSKTENGQADALNGETPESKENTELIPHPLIDNKGQTMANMTFPANWKLHNEPGKAAFTGPGGIQVYNIPIRNFMFTNDEMTRQIYLQNGGKMRQPTAASTIIQQDFVPIAQKEGSKLIKVYSVPGIAKSDSSIQDLMYRIGPQNTKYEAVISEWEDNKGNPYAIVLHLSVTDMGNVELLWPRFGRAKSQLQIGKKNTFGRIGQFEIQSEIF